MKDQLNILDSNSKVTQTLGTLTHTNDTSKGKGMTGVAVYVAGLGLHGRAYGGD